MWYGVIMQSKYSAPFINHYVLSLLSGFILLSSANQVIAENLTLHQAEQIALTEEPGLISQNWQFRSLMEMAIADGQLMDPKLQIGVANLPTDSFDFSQEAMTQLKVSYLQQFPPGDTRELKQQSTQIKSELMHSKMAGRNLTILQDVRLTFLEIFYWEQARETILKNKQLFIQLVDIVQSLFSVGRNDQQDLIRAQLELSRLDDRLTKIDQQIRTYRARLSRWVGIENSLKSLAVELPEIATMQLQDNFKNLSELLQLHPKVQQIDKDIEINRNDIQLVKESLKPGWGLNVSYAFRDEDANGNDRADFISAAVTFDLPLFSTNRQDKKLLSKEHQYQSLKSSRLELIRQLVAELQQEIANEATLLKRQQLYTSLLLPQAKQQAQASLLAYQSDRGSFSDLMRAYMDDLNANLDAKRIAIDMRKTQAKLLYFVPAFRQEIHTDFQ